MNNKTAFLIMRVSVGIVFLLFGIGKLRSDVWAETIKTMDFFVKLPWDVHLSILIIGISEILTGLALIIGLFTRFFALLASVQLLMILVLLRFEEIRDIGLLGAVIYMAIVKNNAFGIDCFLTKQKEKQK